MGKKGNGSRRVLAVFEESARLVDVALKMPSRTSKEKEAFLDTLSKAMAPVGMILIGDVACGVHSSDELERAACRRLSGKFNLTLFKQINSYLVKKVQAVEQSAGSNVKTYARYKEVVSEYVDLWAVRATICELADDKSVVPDIRVRDAFDSEDTDLGMKFAAVADELKHSEFFDRFKETKGYKQLSECVNCPPLFKEDESEV